ncbi:hypothetical protein [Paenarthrobacter sp. CAP02]|uniref:hypothetical protein n=1 Tax=Paenarthrobacter sp. CAP02 TaxID=3158144 RepID=UPI0032DA92D0
MCGTCGDAFDVRLGEVGGVVAQVEAVIPRLTLTATYGERMGGSKAQHAPAPVSVDAVSSLDELQRFLLNTALSIATTNNLLHGRGSGDVADYLAGNMHRIKTLPNAHDRYKQLDALLRNCENVVRVAEQRVFAGNCAECNTDLYAAKGDHEARCKTCGTTYEVLKWRAHAIKAAKYYVGTATDLSRKLAAPEYGYNITADQIRKWGTRLIGGQPKLIRQNPTHDQHGTPLAPTYRLDHVHELATNRKPLDGTAA